MDDVSKDDQPNVEVRRSARRRRTVSAHREDGRTVVLIPARFTRAEEQRWVATMVARLDARHDGRLDAGARRQRRTDPALSERAAELSRRYLGGRARPASVAWVENQHGRWGSCTPAHSSIRISSRLRQVPPWVLDYVLLHELAHLLHPGHGSQFWALLQPFERLERARGYLEGYGVLLAEGTGVSAEVNGADGAAGGPSGLEPAAP